MIRITSNMPQFSAQFQARASVLVQRLVTKINDLTVRLQRRILSRPGSPASASHRRKGWLANSVRPIPATASGSTVTGSVEGAGGAAWYGRLFEDGTSSAYEILASNKKAMAFEMHGEAMVLRKVLHPAFDSDKLAFMSPVLMEMQDEIHSEIKAVTLETLRG